MYLVVGEWETGQHLRHHTGAAAYLANPDCNGMGTEEETCGAARRTPVSCSSCKGIGSALAESEEVLPRERTIRAVPVTFKCSKRPHERRRMPKGKPQQTQQHKENINMASGLPPR